MDEQLPDVVLQQLSRDYLVRNYGEETAFRIHGAEKLLKDYVPRNKPKIYRTTKTRETKIESIAQIEAWLAAAKLRVRGLEKRLDRAKRLTARQQKEKDNG